MSSRNLVHVPREDSKSGTRSYIQRTNASTEINIVRRSKDFLCDTLVQDRYIEGFILESKPKYLDLLSVPPQMGSGIQGLTDRLTRSNTRSGLVCG